VVIRSTTMPKIHVLRDIAHRQAFKDTELVRRSYLYVARNTTLPANVRLQAQLKLTNMDGATRPSIIKNRCTLTGKGRGVLGKWGLCRVSMQAMLYLLFILASISSRCGRWRDNCLACRRVPGDWLLVIWPWSGC
jgi:small subunit ribosomal protein S14